MSDIVERLNRIDIDDQGASLSTLDLVGEAADEIERLRQALRYIGYDYIELSHEKIHWQRDEHIKSARKALEDSYDRHST